MVGTGRIFFSLGYKMILLLIVGQSFRRFARVFATSYKKQFSIVANIAILLIVFISFSVSASDPLFRKTQVDSKGLYLYLALSFLILLTLAYFAARLLRFSREDLVSVVFTAPQKTLAMGVPLLTTIFAENPAVLGLAMLPILIYHPWQLIVSGVVKNMRFLKIE
ncbi:MAG: bile acid:sodium symporter, partial [Spirochaetaceae bacterium]|nr:bile acid:sodium symporter [Spirochaetaceae bacterium]